MQQNRHSRIVLGVDPGTLSTGYGVIEQRMGSIRLVDCGVIRSRPESSLPIRLKAIYSTLRSIITVHHPDEFAIESAFYGKNAQSALKLGHARGVAILAAVEHEIPTAEYSPREVKKAVVGIGTASKEQVRFMVKSLLDLTRGNMILDTSDALAVALCHLHRHLSPSASFRDWKSFIEAHPERIRS
ncbi:MAG: crossover junction endodeoxyribonuclease RuvC [Ignavibacteria bacterium]|nr:crossover junction endodeoxyribonuclease RuvC [Ignavibacteria bacterium]